MFFLILFLLFNFEICNAQITKSFDAEKMMKYAEGLFDAQQYSSAIEAYLQVINFSGQQQFNPRAQFMIGECLQRSGNYYFAVKEWEKVINKYPQSEFANKAKERIKLAKIYLRNIEPPVLTIEEQLANRYISWGDEARERVFTWPDYFIFIKETEFETALYWYNEAIRICPKSELSAKAQFRKGDLYMRISQQDNYEKYSGNMRKETREYLLKGLEEYKIVIASYPETYWADKARLLIGDFYRDNIKDKGQAIKAYQQVIDRYKDEENNYYRIYAKSQIEYLEKLFDTENSYALMSLSNWEMPARFIKENLANKCIDWGNQFRDRSKYWGGNNNVYKEEELETALFWYDMAIKLCPDTELALKAQYSKGNALVFQDRQADYIKAMKEFQKVIDMNPKSHWADEASIKMGDVYQYNLADKKNAIEAYKQLILRRDKDINNYYVSYALTQIKYLGGNIDFMKEK